MLNREKYNFRSLHIEPNVDKFNNQSNMIQLKIIYIKISLKYPKKTYNRLKRFALFTRKKTNSRQNNFQDLIFDE